MILAQSVKCLEEHLLYFVLVVKGFFCLSEFFRLIDLSFEIVSSFVVTVTQ